MQKKLIKIKDIDVLILKKDIKNLYLNVLPPNGMVRVSVPLNVSDDIVKMFVIKKFHWIKKHIKVFEEQERQSKREYVSGESHYFKGTRYVLKVDHAKRPKIEIKNKKYIFFYVPPSYTIRQKQNYYEKWLRCELKKELEILFPKWEKIIGVKASEVRIKKMKTKWGSCNIAAKRIWINLELIKKPREHLEYVIVHELIHLIERRHNKRFKELMSKYLPKWRMYKRQLNQGII